MIDFKLSNLKRLLNNYLLILIIFKLRLNIVKLIKFRLNYIIFLFDFSFSLINFFTMCLFNYSNPLFIIKYLSLIPFYFLSQLVILLFWGFKMDIILFLFGFIIFICIYKMIIWRANLLQRLFKLFYLLISVKNIITKMKNLLVLITNLSW